MRKLFFIIIIAATFTACRNQYGTGGSNAAQYVREKHPEQAANIESIEAVDEDSLLTDLPLTYGRVEFAKAGLEYVQGNMTRKQYESIVDSTENIIYDIKCSWLAGLVDNDSLRKLEKYDGAWRKAYTVRVTMKSSITKDIRVLMDNDGLTPRATEGEFMAQLDEYFADIEQAHDNLIFGP